MRRGGPLRPLAAWLRLPEPAPPEGRSLRPHERVVIGLVALGGLMVFVVGVAFGIAGARLVGGLVVVVVGLGGLPAQLLPRAEAESLGLMALAAVATLPTLVGFLLVEAVGWHPASAAALLFGGAALVHLRSVMRETLDR